MPPFRSKAACSLHGLLLAGVLLLPFSSAAEAPADTAGEGTGVNHQILDDLLARHVHGKGVDYRGIQADLEQLQRYLDQLAKARVEQASRDQKLALYINAYNAFTLRLIARHYPKIDSIRDIANPWGTKRWVIAGKTLSLDQIEHGILRGELKEPRIHFAVTSASISCPPLQPWAFDPKTIHKQLEKVSREFIRSDAVTLRSKKGLLGKKKSILRVNRIFKWFGEDFKPGVAEYIAQYLPPPDAQTIRRNLKRVSIKFQAYDWGLNDYIM